MSRSRVREAMFSRLSEILDHGVLVVKDGIVVQANRALVELFGYESQEFVGHKITDLPGGADLASALDKVVKQAEKSLEATVRRKDGRPIRLKIRAEIVPFNGTAAMMAVISEKIAIDQVYEPRRTSGERFRSIFDSVFDAAPDVIFIKDRDLRFVEVNPAMERILGLPASRIIGKKAEDIFGREAGERITGWDLRVLQGETLEKEHALVVAGERVTFLDVRMPLRNSTGKIIGICGISRDITERKQLAPRDALSPQAYPSRSMHQIMSLASQAAASDSIVLLQGESGTGKDYLARWIHDHSPRASGPFLTINCATVPQALAESELFGHEAGAFTGAKNRKRGLLELAEGGTLLLNEIGELSRSLQSKLLVFLDSRSFLRLGGEKSVQVDARILAATHRDLKAEVAEGRFLEALFYRLNVFSICMPPLRERSEDIPTLALEIVAKIAMDMNLPEIPPLAASSIKRLGNYHWPGNVRELRNVLERGVILWKRGRLDIDVPSRDSEADFLTLKLSFPSGRTLRSMIEEAATSICREAVRRSGGNKKAAARLVGVSRDSLYRYLRATSPLYLVGED
ncbi:MAG: sigma 54-interacting transcriptional regulator [Desulfomonile tiedjei]|uniref:Sigma 54-interacting transcriptional regulator n=1 Tax=Desulfomonile tiedjei TaxID=2358 RepID=A0A9D6VA96_9BACT|nr:sigma 54-interacting transcriptional regulator [Desulfomonile tiedjei]